MDSIALPQVPHLTSLVIGSDIQGKHRIWIQDLVAALECLPNLASLMFVEKPVNFVDLHRSTVAKLLTSNALPHLKTFVIRGTRSAKSEAWYLQKLFSIVDSVTTLEVIEVDVGSELKEFMNLLRSQSPPRVSFPELHTLGLRIANPNEDDIQGLWKYILPALSIALTIEHFTYTISITRKRMPSTKRDNTPQLQKTNFYF